LVLLLKHIALNLPRLALGKLLKALPRSFRSKVTSDEQVMAALNAVATELGMQLDEGVLVSQLHSFPAGAAELAVATAAVLKHSDLKEEFRDFFFIKARQLTIEHGRNVTAGEVMSSGLLLAAATVSQYYPKTADVLSDEATREEWLRILLAAYGADLAGESPENAAARRRELNTLERHVQAAYKQGQEAVGKEMADLEKELKAQIRKQKFRAEDLEHQLNTERARSSSASSPARGGGE
jgi:hypothetical protein